MKNILHSTALFIICLSAAVPVLAECPEGKSEVILMTPKGVTKTICVSDNAIPGIENAAEHSDRVMIEPECPCLDVWDGSPYPEGTLVSETQPSALPDDLTTADCRVQSETDLTIVRADILIDEILYIYVARAVTEERDSCAIDTYAEVGQYAELRAPPVIFTDAAVSQTGLYTSSMMDACKVFLEDRGCVFD